MCRVMDRLSFTLVLDVVEFAGVVQTLIPKSTAVS